MAALRMPSWARAVEWDATWRGHENFRERSRLDFGQIFPTPEANSQSLAMRIVGFKLQGWYQKRKAPRQVEPNTEILTEARASCLVVTSRDWLCRRWRERRNANLWRPELPSLPSLTGGKGGQGRSPEFGWVGCRGYRFFGGFEGTPKGKPPPWGSP